MCGKSCRLIISFLNDIGIKEIRQVRRNINLSCSHSRVKEALFKNPQKNYFAKLFFQIWELFCEIKIHDSFRVFWMSACKVSLTHAHRRSELFFVSIVLYSALHAAFYDIIMTRNNATISSNDPHLKRQTRSHAENAYRKVAFLNCVAFY